MQAISAAQDSAERHPTLHLLLGVDLLHALHFHQSAKTHNLLKRAQAEAQLPDLALQYNNMHCSRIQMRQA